MLSGICNKIQKAKMRRTCRRDINDLPMRPLLRPRRADELNELLDDADFSALDSYFDEQEG